MSFSLFFSLFHSLFTSSLYYYYTHSLSIPSSFVRYQAIFSHYTLITEPNKTKPTFIRVDLVPPPSLQPLSQKKQGRTIYRPPSIIHQTSIPAKNHHIRNKASHSQRLKVKTSLARPHHSSTSNIHLRIATIPLTAQTHRFSARAPNIHPQPTSSTAHHQSFRAHPKTTLTTMRQPLPLTLLLAASARAATVYVTTTCTSTSTTTITHIYASSTQVITSAFPVVQTSVPLSTAPSSPSPSSASPPPSTTLVVPVSVSAPSAGSSVVYSSEVAPFPTAVGTGSAAPVGTGTGTGAGSASGTGAPISPVVPYKGAATRNTGTLLGGVVAVGAVALALF